MEQKEKLARVPMTAPPFVSIDKNYLDLSEETVGVLTLKASPAVLEKDYFLVIDIYFAENHVHPDGHLGWWKFELDDSLEIRVSINKSDEGIRVSFPDSDGTTDSWVNGDVNRCLQDQTLSIHVVLRDASSEAIAFDEAVYLYTNKEVLRKALRRKESILEDFSEAKYKSFPWYCWPRQTNVHIVTVDFAIHDAIGNFVLDLCRLLKRSNAPCTIHAARFDPAFRGLIKPSHCLLGAVRPHDVVFMNLSIYDPWFEAISSLQCKKVLYWHNVTPGEFLQVYNAEYSLLCKKALDQLRYVDRFTRIVANSKFSADYLAKRHGEPVERRLQQSGDSRLSSESGAHTLPERLLENISVIPPVIQLDKWDNIEAEEVESPGDGNKLLYVGRIAPHKKVEDLLALFNEYHKLDRGSYLQIAGQVLFHDYAAYLSYLLQEKYSHLAANVSFLHNISDSRLKTLYEGCSAFVLMSEHEGFCLPLVEAMYFNKPIFAYRQPAIRETLGRSGRQFHEKNFAAVAEDIYQVLHDESAREWIVSGQRKRFDEISEAADGTSVWQILEDVLFGQMF